MNDTYFVCADGRDANDGLSEQKPFQTLAKAVDSARNGSIKTITVIGTLNKESEAHSVFPKDGQINNDREYTGDEGVFFINGSGVESVFFISESGKEEITITGINDACLSGGYEKENSENKEFHYGRMRVVKVSGCSNIRFKNIAITGGNISSYLSAPLSMTFSPQTHNIPAGRGGGLYISPSAIVTLDKNAVVHGNKSLVSGGGGVAVVGGRLNLDGGVIRDNYAEYGGGVHVSSGRLDIENCVFLEYSNRMRILYDKHCQIFGELNMRNGEIIKNTSCDGGGAYIARECTFTMSGGLTKQNTITVEPFSLIAYSHRTKILRNGVSLENGSIFITTGGRILDGKRNNRFKFYTL
ncbi:hypothetical protein AGMMS50212_13650 [Spirochaetia bacterium]|nr:hypothetical protein AGMMS50212_13650 [Spirochaetia bacterium]